MILRSRVHVLPTESARGLCMSALKKSLWLLREDKRKPKTNARRSVMGLFLCSKQEMVSHLSSVTEAEKEWTHVGNFLKTDPTRVADGLNWEERVRDTGFLAYIKE